MTTTTTTMTMVITTTTTRRSMQTKSRCNSNSNGVLLFATMLILAIFSFSANTNTLFVSANTELEPTLEPTGQCTDNKVYYLKKKSRKKNRDVNMCDYLEKMSKKKKKNMCNKKNKKMKVVCEKKNGKRKTKMMSYWKACRCTCTSADKAEANESNIVPSSAPSESPNDGFTGGNTDPGVCPKYYSEFSTVKDPESDTLYAFSDCSSTYEDELTCYYQYTWDGCETSQCRPVVSCTCNESDGLYPNKWTCITETRESCPTPSPTQAPRERKNKSFLRTLREHIVVRNKNHHDTAGSEEEQHLRRTASRRDLTEESASDKNGESCELD